jgi:hypothetical protein
VTFEKASRLEEIAAFAFAGAKLEMIVIPASVKVIGSRAFFRCSQLESVIFEIGSQLQEVDAQAFSLCPCERNISYPFSETGI